MATITSEVTSLVKTMAPGHAERWSDARIKSAVHMADMAICESSEFLWLSSTIDLSDGEMTYTLPSDAIEVRSVEYSRDGLVYDTLLRQTTLDELDRISNQWEMDSGTGPEYYMLLSARGIASLSKILIWRPIPVTGGEKIRVNYYGYRTNADDMDSADLPRDIISRAYLPYALSMLTVDYDLELADQYMAEFNRNIDQVRSRYNHPFIERLGGVNDLS